MRTFDDIIPPSRRKESDGPHKPAGASRPPSRRSSRFPYFTLGIVLVVIIICAAALFYFSGAKVEVTPTSASTAVQGSFSASKSTGDLPFEIVTAQKVATQSVTGSGTKTVNSYASGSITIYNTSSSAQKLIANTRFATASGLIFRIHNSVTVPKGTTAAPGSVTAVAYADQAGATYNIGPSSFTVPGLAGTSQASQVYARSTVAMTGGASGTVPVVDAATETSAKTALMAALMPDLMASIKTQIPDGYVLVPGSATTTFQELTPAPSSTTGMVDVKEQGTVTATVFPNAALAKAIASSVTGLGYQGEPVTLSSADSLSFSAASSAFDPNATSLSFSLSGTASLVYTVDPTRIAAAVSGKTRSAAEVALTNYPEVKRAIIVLRPFWRQSFPQDPTAISVVVTAP